MSIDKRKIDQWVEDLEEAARLLRSSDRLQRLLERDRLGLTPDGMPSGGGERSSGGERSDPTLSAVLQLTDDDNRTAEDKARSRGHADYIHRCAMGALRSATHAAESARQMVGLVNESERIEEKAKTRPGAAACAEPSCEDAADAGREGRCEPCYRWRKRWKDAHPGQLAPAVPPKVIDDRKIRKQRMYDDGRMVS